MQGLVHSVVSDDRLCAPASDARVSIVDVRDIAAVAVAVLTGSGHDGRIYDITGPEALTHAEMASQLSEVLGKNIAFIDISEATMRTALHGFGMPEWQVEGLIEDYAHYRRGEASTISSVVRDITGRPPYSFASFAQDYKQALSA
jgi:uncharacterized protein YbjT (DUF2867 family)